MKKAALILTGLLLPSLFLFSKEVPVAMAERVAVYFTRSRLLAEYDTLFLAKTVTRNDHALCYFFDFPDGKGHIVVAADDRVHPVLAYNRNHSFQAGGDFPPQYTSWMESYYDQIEHVIVNSLPADDAIGSKWAEYLNNSGPPDYIPMGVLPLLTTTWSQQCYYNELCPYDAAASVANCDHCPVGCGATAMAQIMKCHNWPVQGTGSFSYNHPVYGTLSANFGATTYNWAGMPNSLSSSNIDVATISYHCGVSVAMNYTPYGSGSYMHSHKYAYITNFKYDPAGILRMRNSFPTTWEDMLKSELDNGRPTAEA